MGMMAVTMVLTGLNVLLVCGLLYVYAASLSRVRSLHTVGLVTFAALFLVQNVVSFYYYVTMMPFFVEGLEGYALTFASLQFIAFSVMNWITWR